MSRARNLKPGFFKNDLLAECHPLARLLFAGLWCEADRAGRLENRPKRIKAECLPYDECDIDELLGQLEARGFIVRYVVDGQAYIAVPEFLAHQNPHMKEAESTIPAPCKSGAGTGDSGTSPADSLLLIPDSPSQERPAPKVAITFCRWIESLNGSKAIPETDPIFDYAERVKLPSSFLALAWLWFEKTYGVDGRRRAKRYKDWREVFRNSVEGIWSKAWYFDEGAGAYRLTAAGIQLQREVGP